jgi:hypothetical protein
LAGFSWAAELTANPARNAPTMPGRLMLDWVSRGPLRREWFFETGSGNCRLMGPFAAQLAETAPVWRKAIAPYAEKAVKILWQGRAKRSKFTLLPTRLTQARRSHAKGGSLGTAGSQIPETQPRCRLSRPVLVTV